MYSGQLEMSDMSTEQLAEMITLSDRYDVSLYLFAVYSEHFKLLSAALLSVVSHTFDHCSF